MEFLVVPFSYFGMSEDRVVAAKKTGFETARHAIWGWVVFAGWVACILPVTILGFVDRKPFVDVGVVTRDDEFGVLEKVLDDAAVGPGAVLVEQGEWGVQ
jgi:hypothetical protein